jgi:hypothetical protein
MSKNIIIMVFKVSFVIIINLFSCTRCYSWGQQTEIHTIVYFSARVCEWVRGGKGIIITIFNTTATTDNNNNKAICIHIQTCCHCLWLWKLGMKFHIFVHLPFVALKSRERISFLCLPFFNRWRSSEIMLTSSCYQYINT